MFSFRCPFFCKRMRPAPEFIAVYTFTDIGDEEEIIVQEGDIVLGFGFNHAGTSNGFLPALGTPIATGFSIPIAINVYAYEAPDDTPITVTMTGNIHSRAIVAVFRNIDFASLTMGNVNTEFDQNPLTFDGSVTPGAGGIVIAFAACDTYASFEGTPSAGYTFVAAPHPTEALKGEGIIQYKLSNGGAETPSGLLLDMVENGRTFFVGFERL